MIDGYLPLARVRNVFTPLRVQVTVSGDGLASLSLPAALKAVPPTAERIFRPEEVIHCPEIQLESIVMRQHRRAELRLREPASIDPGDLLLAHRNQILIAEIFADIKHLPVHDREGHCGQVVELLDQGVQQSLLIRRQTGEEVLVPYTPAWVEVQKDRIFIEQLELFVP